MNYFLPKTMFDNSECYWHQTTVVFILQSPMFVSSAKKKEKTEKTTPKRKKCNPYLVSIVNNELDPKPVWSISQED